MKIGTRVRVTYEDGTMSDRDFTITAIKGYEEANDWCDHYVVKDDDGDENEIQEWDCVFPPIDDEYDDETTYYFLRDNGVYADVYGNSEEILAVHIDWGDWKHEHLWAEQLMKYLGWAECDCVVTEEDGSDCYSATHYFCKKVER